MDLAEILTEEVWRMEFVKLLLSILHFTSPKPQIEIRRHNYVKATDFKTNLLWSSHRDREICLITTWSDQPHRALIANRYQIRQFLHGKSSNPFLLVWVARVHFGYTIEQYISVSFSLGNFKRLVFCWKHDYNVLCYVITESRWQLPYGMK